MPGRCGRATVSGYWLLDAVGVNDEFPLHLLFGYDSLSTVYAESLTSAHISVHSINTTHG